MTSALCEALRRMSTIREGFVVRNLDGSQKTDGEANWWLARICRRAGLPIHYWHRGFGTHAALFGVNPWRLQTWMGHKRIDETMLYAHVAEAHHREVPEVVPLCANVLETADPVVITLEGQLGFGHDAEHVWQEVQRCSSARWHRVRGPGGGALGRSGEGHLPRTSEAASLHS
jgi:hypothetical protein